MAKPRTPTNVLELKGSFKTHPERKGARENEPAQLGEVGPPPDDFPKEIAAAWIELVRYAPAGVLCEFDRPFMGYAARVYAQIKSSPEVDPKVGVRFEAVCGRLGMTPADRSKVSVVRSQPVVSPLDEFAAG